MPQEGSEDLFIGNVWTNPKNTSRFKRVVLLLTAVAEIAALCCTCKYEINGHLLPSNMEADVISRLARAVSFATPQLPFFLRNTDFKWC